MTSGHRRAVGTITMLLGMVVALTSVIAACGWEVDETASGTVIGKIGESELGSGKSAGATFDLSPGKYVFMCNLGGHYSNGMYAGFTVNSLDDSKSATVGVELGEWFINSDSASVAAGSVTFEVGNIGKSGHELVLIRTDLAPDALVAKPGPRLGVSTLRRSESSLADRPSGLLVVVYDDRVEHGRPINEHI